jgi:hypothetical protein
MVPVAPDSAEPEPEPEPKTPEYCTPSEPVGVMLGKLTSLVAAAATLTYFGMEVAVLVIVLEVLGSPVSVFDLPKGICEPELTRSSSKFRTRSLWSGRDWSGRLGTRPSQLRREGR